MCARLENSLSDMESPVEILPSETAHDTHSAQQDNADMAKNQNHAKAAESQKQF